MGELHALIRTEMDLPSGLSALALCHAEITILPNDKPTVVTTSDHPNCCWDNANKLIVDGSLAKNYMTYHHSVINFVDGCYTIKDLETEKRTFINGMELGYLKSHKLVDGDILCFGLTHKDPIFRKLDHPKILFYFKGQDVASGLPKITENTQEEMYPKSLLELNESVFGNDLILQEILSSLALPALKVMRQVNSFWNGESSQYLYAKSLKRIPPKNNVDFENLQGFPPHCKNATVHVSLSECNFGTPPEQIMGKILLYIKTYGVNIKFLQVELSASLFGQLLRLMPHLVNLYGLKLALFGPGLQNNSDECQFASVKSLEIVEFFHSSSSTFYNSFRQKLLGMFPSLEKLSVDFGPSGKLTPKMDILLDNIKSTPNILKGVRKFAARFLHMREEHFSIYQTLLELPFGQPLTSLELTLLSFVATNQKPKDKRQTVVFQILEKFSGSLKRLCLEIGHKHGKLDDKSTLTYSIPPLPQLQVLEITSYLNSDRDKGDKERKAPWFKLVTKRRNQNKMFPKLKTLTFKYPLEKRQTPQEYSFEKDCLRVFKPFIQAGEEKRYLSQWRGLVFQTLEVMIFGAPKIA